MSGIMHDTIVVERAYGAAVARVYAAFADPVARAMWSVPSDSATLIYDACDFRVGGRDLFRCGSKSDPKYHGEARYLQIVPMQQIVYCETIDVDGSRLSASLNTIQLKSDGRRTHLKVTIQVAAFGGREMIDGTRFGHNAAMAHLAEYLREEA